MQKNALYCTLIKIRSSYFKNVMETSREPANNISPYIF